MKILYQADNGKTFESESECKAYELAARITYVTGSGFKAWFLYQDHEDVELMEIEAVTSTGVTVKLPNAAKVDAISFDSMSLDRVVIGGQLASEYKLPADQAEA